MRLELESFLDELGDVGERLLCCEHPLLLLYDGRTSRRLQQHFAGTSPVWPVRAGGLVGPADAGLVVGAVVVRVRGTPGGFGVLAGRDNASGGGVASIGDCSVCAASTEAAGSTPENK